MSSDKARQLERLLYRRSFRGLMAVYEHNYSMINRLLPQVRTATGCICSSVTDHPALYCRIEEQNRYTTTLRLTYFLDIPEQGRIADPDLLIRVYHDTRQCEVMSCRLNGFMPIGRYDDSSRPVIDCKWDSNLFLEKWLDYTLSKTYSFANSQETEWPADLIDLEAV